MGVGEIVSALPAALPGPSSCGANAQNSAFGGANMVTLSLQVTGDGDIFSSARTLLFMRFRSLAGIAVPLLGSGVAAI